MSLRGLLVTSRGAPPSAVTPVLAALEASELEVRAIDVGRAGSRDDGTVGRVVRAIAGEFAERRVQREVEENPPDVMLAFDPSSVNALTTLRDASSRPTPVIAIVAELEPGDGWAGTDADRYLAVDKVAAVALADGGIEGHRVIPVGPVVAHEFSHAGTIDRAGLRRRFKLSASEPVVVVDVDGFGYEVASQIALQLSLVSRDAAYLFDAGSDVEAATALRRQVPTLELRAKLFGETEDASLLWRAANVAVLRPDERSVARALAIGVRVVSFLPEDKRGERLASALAARGIGRTATNALLISSALEPLLGERAKVASGADGAANIADVAVVVAGDRERVIADTRAAAHEPVRERVAQASAWADATAKRSRVPGELEDLSGAAVPEGPEPISDSEIGRLKAEISGRMNQINRIVAESQTNAEKWKRRQDLASKKGDSELERQAARNGDAERARMHAALAEMAHLSNEAKELDRAASSPRPRQNASRQAPPRHSTDRQSVDSLLDEMKRGGKGGTSVHNPSTGGKKKRVRKKNTVDDELAALKRKMAGKTGAKKK